MTYDDGIVNIYSVVDEAENGLKPKAVLKNKAAYYFAYETVGVTRYYEAQRADSQIDETIRIYQDRTIFADDIAVIDDIQFRISQIQHKEDEDGIRISLLSLERINEHYDYSKA